MEALETSSSSWVGCRIMTLSPGSSGIPQLSPSFQMWGRWATPTLGVSAGLYLTLGNEVEWKEEVISEWKLQESTEALSSSLLLLPFDHQCAIWQMLCHLEAHRMKKMK